MMLINSHKMSLVVVRVNDLYLKPAQLCCPYIEDVKMKVFL